jgi:hypothetical protein
MRFSVSFDTDARSGIRRRSAFPFSMMRFPKALSCDVASDPQPHGKMTKNSRSAVNQASTREDSD